MFQRFKLAIYRFMFVLILGASLGVVGTVYTFHSLGKGRVDLGLSLGGRHNSALAKVSSLPPSVRVADNAPAGLSVSDVGLTAANIDPQPKQHIKVPLKQDEIQNLMREHNIN